MNRPQNGSRKPGSRFRLLHAGMAACILGKANINTFRRPPKDEERVDATTLFCKDLWRRVSRSDGELLRSQDRGKTNKDRKPGRQMLCGLSVCLACPLSRLPPTKVQ